MALRTSTTSFLTLSLLLASASAASAGFVWVPSENGNTTQAGSYSRQAEPTLRDGTMVQGREWKTEESVPQAAAQIPLSAVAPSTAPITLTPATPVAPVADVQMQVQAPTVQAQPITLTPATPSDLTLPPVAVASPAPAAPAAVLTSGTVASSPIYSRGDHQAAAPVSVTAPSVYTPVTLAAPAVSQPVAPTETALGSMSTANPMVSSSTPAVAGMPTAESMINNMPSMTSPILAPSAPPVAAAPVALTPAVTPKPTVRVTAPAVTVPNVTVTPPAATAPVSALTGQAVTLSPAEATAVSTPAATTAVGDIVSGFGKQVPLVVALRQILPPSYSFAHRSGVDLSQLVDWQGGKNWQQVLSETLAPIGVKATIMGNAVLLEKAQ